MTSALLLLLAVAACQVDFSLSLLINGAGETNITSCPIAFYGRTYTRLNILTSPNLMICFKNNTLDPDTDCLSIKDGGIYKNTRVSAIFAKETQFVGAIGSNSSCRILLVLRTSSSDLADISLYNFGPQASMKLDVYSGLGQNPFDMSAVINNATLESWYYTAMDYSSTLYISISGCRLSDGDNAVTASYESYQGNCSKTVCPPSGILKNVSTCGLTDSCQNDKCIPPPYVCTVTGSTVVDFFDRDLNVTDRCTYTLMRSGESARFKLLARFRERRRKDVSFLDGLILELTNVTLYLEQGGRVWADFRHLTLNTTAQMIEGAELRKDKAGVTVKIPDSNMTVFFDGYTAQVSGPAEDVNGLCGNLTDSKQTTILFYERSNSYSATGCETQYSDTNDDTINCTRATEHCNLMNQAPFSDCHNYTDPAPYISACKTTLCSYPSVDGLSCQFLEAYSRACSLKRYMELEDWRPMASCSVVPQASCRDQYCSDHEFCGVNNNETRCLCRAIFASPYRGNNTLGKPTVCKQNTASLTLVGCLLEDYNINYADLHLNDENCTGRMDRETHMLTFSFNSSNECGANVTRNNSQVIFQNTIMQRNLSNNNIINYQDPFEIDFTCSYNELGVQTFFKIKDSSVVQQVVSGPWNYVLMMNAYTDFNRRNPVGPGAELQLNQKIWVELKTEGLENSMVLVVTDSCWATNMPTPNGTLKHYLITGGCPSPGDQTVIVSGNGQGLSTLFSFSMFEFTGIYTDVYLYCQLELCPKQSNNCVPSCGGASKRRRRSSRFKNADKYSTLIAMTWSK